MVNKPIKYRKIVRPGTAAAFAKARHETEKEIKKTFGDAQRGLDIPKGMVGPLLWREQSWWANFSKKSKKISNIVNEISKKIDAPTMSLDKRKKVFDEICNEHLGLLNAERRSARLAGLNERQAKTLEPEIKLDDFVSYVKRTMEEYYPDEWDLLHLPSAKKIVK